MTITIKLFAILRDLAGASEITQKCSPGITVAEIAAQLSREHSKMNPFLSKVAYAVNEQFVAPNTQLRDGDVLALIPPVSGG